MSELVRPADWSQLPSRSLAYVGDAVYELHIRERGLLASGKVHQLHQATIAKVSAEGQARVAQWLYEKLTEEEQAVFRRARNTKSAVPRRASVQHYRLSTAFEALIGYLHLKRETERLNEILALTDDFLEATVPASSPE
jgi:ribonuclease-3 family protein